MCSGVRGRLVRTLCVFGTVAALFACVGCFEYSPHAVPEEARHRDVHQRSLERLLAQPAPERLRFAFVGDTQLGFNETEDCIQALNGRDDLAFVVQVGDFTHVGTAREYELTNGMFAKLKFPYFVAIGNHDTLSNGRKIFESMFGPWNFAFTWAETRFVFLDTNSVEVGFDGTVPDLAWLAEALAPSPDHRRAFVFSHADPNSNDFDPRLVPAFREILRSTGVVASLHGHAHQHLRDEHDGVQYVNADEIDAKVYYVVTERDDGGFDIEEVHF